MLYGELVRERAWRRMFVASTTARLPLTMGTFALVLAGHRLGSYALGARLTAFYSISGAIGAALRGRQLDRGDLRKGLRRDCLLCAVFTSAIAVLVLVKAPWPALALTAILAGAAVATVSSAFRSLMPSVVPPEQLNKAYALDAVCVEACFVAGPAMAAAVAVVGGPSAVFALMGLCCVIAAVATTTVTRPYQNHEGRPGTAPEARLTSGDRHDGISPLRVPLMTGILIGCFGIGLNLGVVETLFPPFAALLGAPAADGGILASFMAVGSGLGGLTFGPRIASAPRPGRRSVVLLSSFGLLIVPFALAPSIQLAAVVALLAGMPFAVLATITSTLIARRVDQRRSTEAFALTTTCIWVGLAIGGALCSSLQESLGIRRLLLLSGLPPIAAAAAIVLLRGWIGRQPHQRCIVATE
jgi:MFS family permease